MDTIRARRSKNVSEKLREVSDGDKREAAKARLEALENDDAVLNEDPAAGSDEEFQLEDSEEEGGRLTACLTKWLLKLGVREKNLECSAQFFVHDVSMS